MYRKVRNTSKPFGERVTALNKLRLNLKNQAIAVVCVSALISCVCYLILNSVGTYLLDQCLSKQVHVEQRNKEMLQSLQEYVSQQDLHVEDTNDIDIWLDSQREGYLMIGIYQKRNRRLYDTNHCICRWRCAGSAVRILRQCVLYNGDRYRNRHLCHLVCPAVCGLV